MKADISRLTFDRTKHYAAVIQQQGRVQIDADWNEQAAIARHLAEASLRDVLGPFGAPAATAGFGASIITTDGGSDELRLGAGRYYVDGILCENEADVAFAAQPYLPGATLPFGNVLLYLEVWRRVVTPMDDPAMRETALGEADTTVRLQTAWQVKATAAEDGPPANGLPPGWDALTAAPTGRMKATMDDTRSKQEAAVLFGFGAFDDLENQLYRVEVHTGGDLSTAVFKWSRDNGVVTATVTAFNVRTLTVDSLGRDATLGFATGQWVEITTANDELAGLPGRLARVSDVTQATLQIVLDEQSDLTGLDATQNLRLRRWDGVLPAAEDARKTQPLSNSSDLEAGVSVSFEDGTFRAGDYWLIPSRSTNATIEWPKDTSLPPHGAERHFAPLALVENEQGALRSVTDLRRTFSALTDTVQRIQSIQLTAVHLGGSDTKPPFTTPSVFYEGVTFEFSDAVSAECLNDGAFEVLIDQYVNDLSYNLVRLRGTITTISRNLVNWRPHNSPGVRPTATAPAQNPLEYFLGGTTFGEHPIYLRVTLRGSMIWSDEGDGQRRYLDGTAMARENGVYTFPSGVGLAASDFVAAFPLRTS